MTMYEPTDLRGLLTIFTFDKKRELERYCRQAVIYDSDFVAFIRACDRGAMPFLHRIHCRDRVPPHLMPSDSGLKALADNGVRPLKRDAARTVRKVFQLFEERRYLVGHLFHTPCLHEWHFFCFDQPDIEQKRPNHWKKGPHVHLTNWLWPRQNAQSVWSRFVGGSFRPEACVHVRFSSGAG